MKLITSVQNPYIKKLILLKSSSIRYQENLFLIEGLHLINEAIKLNLVQEILINKEKINCLPSKALGFTTIVSENVISKLSSTSSKNTIIAVCSMPILKTNSYNTNWLILDNIQDPGNLGTLLRSAYGFNFWNIVASKDSVDFYNDKVIRSTQGYFLYLNLIREDLKLKINELKKMKFTIIGTDLKTDKIINLNKLKNSCIDSKIALILGNEGNGISSNISKLVDFNLKIDTVKDLNSLNVAVAGSIIMHSVYQNISEK